MIVIPVVKMRPGTASHPHHAYRHVIREGLLQYPQEIIPVTGHLATNEPATKQSLLATKLLAI